MVEYPSLDTVFAALADPTRRDILRRVAHQQLSIGELAQSYNLTFAAVSKHLKVLERANLIVKQRRGKEQLVSLIPGVFSDASRYLQWYQQHLEERMDSLEAYINNDTPTSSRYMEALWQRPNLRQTKQN